MARVTAPLPLPDDPAIAALFADWPEFYVREWAFPRSAWLRQLEAILKRHYPASTSKQRTLTARLAAPFPLARPGVP